MRKESRARFTVVGEEHSSFSLFPLAILVVHSSALSFSPPFSFSLSLCIYIYISLLSLICSPRLRRHLRLCRKKICRFLAVKSLSLNAFQTAKRKEKLVASGEGWFGELIIGTAIIIGKDLRKRGANNAAVEINAPTSVTSTVRRRKM